MFLVNDEGDDGDDGDNTNKAEDEASRPELPHTPLLLPSITPSCTTTFVLLGSHG